MGPMFERTAGFHKLGQVRRPVLLAARPQDQIMGTRQRVDAVDLHKPEVVDDALQIAPRARAAARPKQQVLVQKHRARGLIIDDQAGHGWPFWVWSTLRLVVAPAIPYLIIGMAKKPDQNPNYKVIAENRRARYDFAIESDVECGIILAGSEVKSLRVGQSNIADSYATVAEGELWLINSYIAPYQQAMFPHEDRSRRKLLVSKRELVRMGNAISREGMTLVPLVMYFNHKGRVKVKIAIAKGKQKQDKRATEAARDWGRQKARLLRHGD
jgi:SsrA-binding protein